MDLVMPGMDGVETTRRIMASTPCAILLVTVSVRVNASLVFEAMGHGALDAVDTPLIGAGTIEEARRAAPGQDRHDLAARRRQARPGGARRTGRAPSSPRRHDRLVAIGASAGGPTVLATVLRGLPKDFPAAIVIVQHVDEQFAAGMAEWLDQDRRSRCGWPKRETGRRSAGSCSRAPATI